MSSCSTTRVRRFERSQNRSSQTNLECPNCEKSVVIKGRDRPHFKCGGNHDLLPASSGPWEPIRHQGITTKWQHFGWARAAPGKDPADTDHCRERLHCSLRGVSFHGSQFDLCPRKVIFSDTSIEATKERRKCGSRRTATNAVYVGDRRPTARGLPDRRRRRWHI